MSGLMSSTPSQSAIRLALGGFLLMHVQSLLLLWAPGLDAGCRALVWVLTPIAFLTLVASLVGMPDPPAPTWSRRHDR